MAMADQTAPRSFNLGMLIYDTRYRSMTIQIFVLILFMLGAVWLVDNMLGNLADLGKPLGFKFLSDPAGYDINQRLIEYNSQNTHFRAAQVGLLNTLLVAFMGCILATILGVSIGVLRLSKNWIVSRLMTVYIEAFRNVPVLLWIVFAMAIFIEVLPQPKEFRGVDPEASMVLGDSAAFTNRGFYFVTPAFVGNETYVSDLTTLLASIDPEQPQWSFIADANAFVKERDGVLADLEADSRNSFFIADGALLLKEAIIDQLTDEQNVMAELSAIIEDGFDEETAAVLAEYKAAPYDRAQVLAKVNAVQSAKSTVLWIFAAVFVLSIVAIVIFGKWAKSVQEKTGKLLPTFWINLAILFVPLIIAFYLLGKPLVLEYPYLKGFNFTGGIYMRNSLIALWLALSLYTAAFIAEAVRSGIMAISKGQTEAAAALGLRPKRIMSLVVLPQAMRVIIPPLISQYLNLTKNSSLAIAVGYMDITGTLGGITLNQTGREMESIMLLMGIYLVISLSISTVMNVYNNSVKLKER